MGQKLSLCLKGEKGGGGNAADSYTILSSSQGQEGSRRLVQEKRMGEGPRKRQEGSRIQNDGKQQSWRRKGSRVDCFWNVVLQNEKKSLVGAHSDKHLKK